MIHLPDWLEDRRITSLLITLDAYPVTQFLWECKNEPPIEIERQLTDEELDLILKNGVPVLGGKVQVFYVKSQYIPNYYKSKLSPLKLHLTKCGSVKAGESRGNNSYVLTTKIGDYFKVNLKDSSGKVYASDVDVQMNICINCLKAILKPPINFPKPTQFNSFELWAEEFDVRAFLEYQNTKAYDRIKSDLEHKNSKSHVVFVKDIKCSRCDSEYDVQTRNIFKHLSVDNGPCLCYNCYSEKYPDLFDYVSRKHFKIARIKLRKPHQIKIDIDPIQNSAKTKLSTAHTPVNIKSSSPKTRSTSLTNNPSHNASNTKSRIIIAFNHDSKEKYIYSLKLPNHSDFTSLRKLVNSIREKDDIYHHIKLYTSEYRKLKSAEINNELEIYGIKVTIQNIIYPD